jgi:hypothetical protein
MLLLQYFNALILGTNAPALSVQWLTMLVQIGDCALYRGVEIQYGFE